MKKSIALLLVLFVGFNVLAQKKPITLEDMWMKYMFFGDGVHGLRSMNDGVHYSNFASRAKKRLTKHEYSTGNEVLELFNLDAIDMTFQEFKIENVDDYAFSADEQKIVFSFNTKPIYRYSSTALYFVYDRESNGIAMLHDAPIMYATLAPKGNNVAYVYNNNLYWKNLDNNEEHAITKDGEKNKIINGASDWVYEEELELVRAFEWSPDGRYIAYYRFDESNVKEFSLTMYGELYPEEYKFKYPKAGEENSKVSIHIFDTKTGKSKKLDLGEDWEYIARIHWTKTPGKLAVQTLNRHQNKLHIIMADAASGATKIIYKESTNTYLEIPNHLTFLKDGKHFVILSEQDGYKHIYKYNMDGKKVTQITKGNWVVTDFYGVDEANGLVYYQAAERSPLEREVYAVGLDGEGKKLLTKDEGWNSASFSKTFEYFIHTYSNASTPSTYVLRNSKGKKVRVLQDNERLKKNLETFETNKKEFFNFKSEHGHTLNGWMIKPNGFDASKKYPVFMFVYGGPGSQTVQNMWGGMNDIWFQMLAQKGYIVVSVDNRGTGARGVKFKKSTYKELGKLETEDQIATAKYMAKQTYVDKSRIGIFGWSYGGYMTSLCLTKGADHFKMGIAVAPVTTWRYYDSIYTERYMQTPQENAKGYDDNSPINHVKELKGKYFIIHGMADDNVHFQNAVDMISALVNANKQFEQFSYPNKNHGIYGGITRYHLYNMMTNYILENL